MISTSFTTTDHDQAYTDWTRFCTDEEGQPPLDRLDAVVLRKEREKANLFFHELEWQSTPLNELYVLWQKDLKH